MASFACDNGPLNKNNRPLFRKRMWYKHFPFQLGLSSRHKVSTYCCAWPCDLRLCSHSRKEKHRELHLVLGITNSPTLRSSWTKCLQRRQKSRPLIKCSDFSIRQCSGGLAWLYRSANSGARGGWGGECWSLPSSGRSAHSQVKVWLAIKKAPASSLLHRNRYEGLLVPSQGEGYWVWLRWRRRL